MPIERQGERPTMSGAEQTVEPRESMDFDVVIVGAGPAGLAAAIRLKQIAPNLSVVVVEKGSEVGAHILSGVVMDPGALDALLPDWRADPERPMKTAVLDDRFYYLTRNSGVRLPNAFMPKLMSNHGNFIGSLGSVARFLGARAEALGVDIYPGFSASEILYDEANAVVGVATGDMGIGKDGRPTSNFTRGMELRGRYTLLAEGARGSLAKQVIALHGLHENGEPQKYGIGLKELWQVRPEHFHAGRVQHSFGWPLDNATGGGSFLYHFDDRMVAVGFVVHLNYSNPTLSPFDEFQRFKTHPMIRDTFSGAERLSYGARAITEGGWQSVPKLAFPGGALIGCAAGFVNVPRIKGSHNAIWSGMQAAEAAAAALGAGRSQDILSDYDAGWRASPIGRDLKTVRNVKPLWSKLGTIGGVALGGLDMWSNALLGVSPFGTLKHGKPDFATLKPLSAVTPITYPRPDGKLTFDRLSSVFLSGTTHEENQPPHLVLRDASIPIAQNLPLYGEPARLYCPAGVYEVVYADEAKKTDPRFVINAQNCVHCKTCDIKDPAQNITWVPPEGAGGPNYAGM
jgi:electron-transferring-flavoprotein dehydrogenase